MFNVGGGELMLIALVALLVLGPDKLPDFARKSARILGQLRSMSQGFQNEMKSVMDFDGDGTTAQASPGPRLVGPIDEGDGPAIGSTPATGSGSTSGSTPASDPTPASDQPPPSGSGRGDEGTSSGTSAA